MCVSVRACVCVYIHVRGIVYACVCLCVRACVCVCVHALRASLPVMYVPVCCPMGCGCVVCFIIAKRGMKHKIQRASERRKIQGRALLAVLTVVFIHITLRINSPGVVALGLDPFLNSVQIVYSRNNRV